MNIKVLSTIILIILNFTFFGYADNVGTTIPREGENPSMYGEYTFKEVSYLSPLSSSTIDYMNKKNVGAKYTIKADLFKIESTDNTYEIKSPKYLKEEIPKEKNPFSNVRSFIGDEVEYQYSIPTSNYRLYVSSDCLWIASYVDNTADGSEIIMYIFKLSK